MQPPTSRADTRCEQPARRLSPDTVCAAIFFTAFYAYVWLVIDPCLVQHSIGITSLYRPVSFHTGWPFFAEHLARPGGLVEYATRLLTEYFVGWAGALTATAIACGLYACAVVAVRSAGRPRWTVLPYVPAMLVLVMYSAYGHPLGPILALLTGLSGFVLYVRLAPPNKAARASALVLGCAALYQIGGAGSLLVAAMAASYELLVSRRIALAATAAACGLGVPWVMGRLLGLDPLKTYGELVIFDRGVGVGQWPYALALFFPGLLAAAAVWSAVFPSPGRRASAPHKAREPKRGSSPGSGRNRLVLPQRWAAMLAPAVVLLAAVSVARLCYDPIGKAARQIDYYSQREQWPEVLATAAKLPRGGFDCRSHRNIMLALHHTGQLGDRMFQYTQPPGHFLYRTPDAQRDVGTHFQESRLYLDLGLVNMAQKAACEALEACGDLPAVLEELALIGVVKRQPETAAVFLNALAQHPRHRRDAQDMLRRLEADPGLDDDPRVVRIRQNMIDNDSVSRKLTAEGLLVALLEKNPRNQMAFELLMAHALCAAQPEPIAAHLERLKDFSYPKTPRHFQEAMAVCASAKGSSTPLAGHTIDPQVLREMQSFAQILSSAASREAAFQRSAAAGFGGSYFFYYTFHTSGR